MHGSCISDEGANGEESPMFDIGLFIPLPFCALVSSLCPPESNEQANQNSPGDADWCLTVAQRDGISEVLQVSGEGL